MTKRFAFVLLLLLLSASLFGADTDIFSFANSISGKVIWDSRTGSGQVATSRYVYNFIPGIPWVVTDKGDKIGHHAVYRIRAFSPQNHDLVPSDDKADIAASGIQEMLRS